MFKSKKIRTPKFYLYGLQCPLDSIIKYVGITINPKSRISHHLNNQSENKKKVKWINQLKEKGLRPELIIIDEFNDRFEASVAELKYIERFRENLLNGDLRQSKYPQKPIHSSLEHLFEVTFSTHKETLGFLNEIAKNDNRSREMEISFLIRKRYEEIQEENKIKFESSYNAN